MDGSISGPASSSLQPYSALLALYIQTDRNIFLSFFHSGLISQECSNRLTDTPTHQQKHGWAWYLLCPEINRHPFLSF